MEQRQGLAWTMLRKVHNMFTFVDSHMGEKDCNSQQESAWDKEEEMCFRMWKYQKPESSGPLDEELVAKLGNKEYDLNKLAGMKNAYHCWLDSDGKVGKLDTKTQSKEGGLPKCAFPATVVKGYIDDKGFTLKDFIVMDKWPGQKAADTWFPEDMDNVDL